jgi:excisionase family DNA binding protein
MRERITMQPSEEPEIRELHRMLNLGTPALVGPNEERLDLPDSVYHLLKDVVANMMHGRTVVVTPQTSRLTTQEAAEYLGFSRPHLVKLLEAGAIPFEKVGQHRRIHMRDLMIYRRLRDAERRAALNELARAEFSEGSYQGFPLTDAESDE